MKNCPFILHRIDIRDLEYGKILGRILNIITVHSVGVEGGFGMMNNIATVKKSFPDYEFCKDVTRWCH